jgi:hypothetical protein
MKLPRESGTVTIGKRQPGSAKRRTPARLTSGSRLPAGPHPRPGAATRGRGRNHSRRQPAIAGAGHRHPRPQGSLQRGLTPAPPLPTTACVSHAVATAEEIGPMTPCIHTCPATRLYVATQEKATGRCNNNLLPPVYLPSRRATLGVLRLNTKSIPALGTACDAAGPEPSTSTSLPLHVSLGAPRLDAGSIPMLGTPGGAAGPEPNPSPLFHVPLGATALHTIRSPQVRAVLGANSATTAADGRT